MAETNTTGALSYPGRLVVSGEARDRQQATVRRKTDGHGSKAREEKLGSSPEAVRCS